MTPFNLTLPPPELFSNNPQYLLHLTEADDDDDPHHQHDPKTTETCTVVLSLTQRHRRVRKLPLLRLGVVVYEVSVCVCMGVWEGDEGKKWVTEYGTPSRSFQICVNLTINH